MRINAEVPTEKATESDLYFFKHLQQLCGFIKMFFTSCELMFVSSRDLCVNPDGAIWMKLYEVFSKNVRFLLS